MARPRNDPKLHTLEGLAEALDEANGEMGAAIEWGWVNLGTVYLPTDCQADPSNCLKPIKAGDNRVELWGALTLDVRQVEAFLRADAMQHLPPNTRYELRRSTLNYGRTHGMCWYRNDAMVNREEWGRVPSKPEQRSGYLLVGEFTTPLAPDLEPMR